MLNENELEELKEELRKAFSDYYEAAGGWEFRYHHLLRARRYAVKLIESDELQDREFDERVVEVAALFHDIGRKEDVEDGHLDPIETHEGHAETGAEIVEEHVSSFLDEGQLEKVEKAVRNHHSEPETLEGKIVQDADDLGKFSTIDIWRLIHYASDNQRTLEETFDYFWNELEPENAGLVEQLYFETSKQAARERLEGYRETIKRMEKEALGDDIDG